MSDDQPTVRETITEACVCRALDEFQRPDIFTLAQTPAMFAATYEALHCAIWKIRNHKELSGNRLTEAELEAEIDAVSGYCDSDTRLFFLLKLLRLPSIHRDLFWRVLAEHWLRCDATWKEQTSLLRLLRKHSPAPPRPTFPEEMTVFRGCSRERVFAVSWTLDTQIAEGFARGHRGIRVPDAVIARAQIKRDAIFLHITGRNEDEVLLDPAKLVIEELDDYCP